MGSEQKLCVDEVLLRQPVKQPAPVNHDGHWPSLPMLMAIMCLTFNSVIAVYRSNGDVEAISFVVFVYLDLVTFIYLCHLYVRTEPESPRREHIRMAVWLLFTMLTVVISYKVAEVMPFPVQVVVWAMAGMTVLGCFYILVLMELRRNKEDDGCGMRKLPI